MSSLNKILLTFLLIMALAFVLVWRVVQSETFAKILSTSITKISKEKFNLDIKFEKLNFKFFPPGAEIYNVSLSSQFKGEMYLLESMVMGVNFDLLDSFETDLTIKELYLQDGLIQIPKLVTNGKKSTSNDKNEKFSPKKAVEEIFEILEKQLPVKIRGVKLKDTRIEYGEIPALLSKLDLVLKDQVLELDAQVDEVELAPLIGRPLYLDRLSLDLSLSKDTLTLRSLKGLERLNVARISGTAALAEIVEKLEYDLKIKTLLDLPDLHDYLPIEQVGKINKGIGKLDCGFKGQFKSFKSSCKLELQDFDSDFVYGDNANLDFSVNNKGIYFNKFNLSAGDQKINLLRSFIFYDFVNHTFIDDPILAEATNLKFDNALRILKKQLGVLTGELSGKVKFLLGSNDFHFHFEPDAEIRDLSLKSDQGLEILGAEYIKLNTAKFDINDFNVTMDLQTQIRDTKVNIRGGITDGVASFNVFDSYINLSEFKEFAGFKIKGRGPVSMKINSPIESTVMKINAKLSAFDFEEYQIDEIESEFDIDLGKGQFVFKKINGSKGRSKISGTGAISFANLDLGFDIQHSSLHYDDMRAIYYPLMKDLTFMPDKFLGEMKANITLGGKADLQQLKVFGKLSGKNLYVYDESFDSLNVEFVLENKMLNFRQIDISKSRGKILSIVGVNLNNSQVVMRGNVKDLSLLEFNNYMKLPLKIQGKLNGNYYIEFENGFKKLESQVYVIGSSIEGSKVGDSYLDINYGGNVLNLNGHFFDKTVVLKSSMDLEEKYWSLENRSYVDININLDELQKYISMLKGINDGHGLEGKIYSSINSQFNFSNLNGLNLDFYLDELLLSKSRFFMHIKNSQGNELVKIRQGEIINWDFELRGNNVYIISKAKGNFLSKFDINTRIKVDASLLEVFNAYITTASGVVLLDYDSWKNANSMDAKAVLTSNNLALTTEVAPLEVRSSKIKLVYQDGRVNLEKFLLELTNGEVQLDGHITMTNRSPDLSLKYNIKNAKLNFFKKTTVEVSGSGAILGAAKPYTINGDLVLNKTNVLNEFSELKKGNSIAAQKVKYLPETTGTGLDNNFVFNISIITQEPAKIVNSMADVAFTSNLQLLGNEFEPKLSGKISIAQTHDNTLMFQNNEFKLGRGDIFFNEGQSISNPEIDFLARATIAKYNLTARVYGPVSHYNTSLSSDPSLPQQNILSLIAFGYAEDVSDALTQSDKESLTRAGIGSMIFDSFKISQALKSELGLQVNVGTEITRNEGSYLSKGASESSNNVGRVRSATKIEIKKDLTKDVSMGVTSTVGGTSGERQSMNLNYKINQKYSLEGVYQGRTTNADEQTINENSIGADFKIKWSFK